MFVMEFTLTIRDTRLSTVAIGAHCFMHWNRSSTTSRNNNNNKKYINKKQKRGYICFPKGISLINAECVVISWGILSCPPFSGCVYVISIVVIEECQKYFIKRSAVIPRTLFWHFAYYHGTVAWSMRPKAAFVPIMFLPLCFMKENTSLVSYFVYLMTLLGIFAGST